MTAPDAGKSLGGRPWGLGLCGGLAVPGILVACGMVVGLWLLQVEGTLRQAMTSHARLVLRQVQSVAEAGMGLGLELEELWRLTDLLDRLRAGDPDLGALAILDERGVAIFATSRAEVGVAPLQGLTLHAVGGDSALRTTSEPGATVYTLPLSTAFGTGAGQVLLRIPDAVIRARLIAFALELLPQAALVATGGALLALVLALWARGRLDRRLVPVTAALWALREPVQEGSSAQEAGESPREAAAESVADPFIVRQRERLVLLSTATAEITRLDETA